MNTRKHSLQQYRWAVSYKRWGLADTIYVLLVIVGAVLVGVRIPVPSPRPVDPIGSVMAQESVVSPLPLNPATPTPSPTPQASLENVVAYIAQVFKSEGSAVVVEAINCFYSESRLNPNAYNQNRNGTEDRGVAQVNSIHRLTPAEAHNFRKNINKAYEIYQKRGWAAWYGKGCGRLSYER